MTGIGHNQAANQNLRNLVERIERGEEEKREAAEAVKEIYAEAKAFGFDTKIIRKIIAERKKDAAEREEEEALLDLYRSALGMLADTPLGQHAMERDGVTAKEGAKP